MTATTNYRLLEKQLHGLIAEEQDALANTANLVGLLFNSIADINWLGVYVVRDEELVLGPYQGLPACVRIPIGQGVCGTAVSKGQTLRVADVHSFAGHIVCDPNSRSELVIPLENNEVFAVLDIDSPSENRFSAADQHGVEALCHLFVQQLIANGIDTKGFI